MATYPSFALDSSVMYTIEMMCIANCIKMDKKTYRLKMFPKGRSRESLSTG